MPTRQRPLPRLWLFTDARLGDGLLPAARALPRGSGIILRQRALPPDKRRTLARQLARIARRRGHLLLIAAPMLPGVTADGVHLGTIGSGRPAGHRRGIVTAAAHNQTEMARGAVHGAMLIFLSPVYATKSHPGARPLGPARFADLAAMSNVPVAALGGMNRARARMLTRSTHGWGAIDALKPRQKWMSVPT